MPIETVLVADRGLLGARVVRAVRALGARAVTVHVDGEKGLGDESVLLGAPGSEHEVVKVLEAARQSGADALHPCGGPLACSIELAEAVLDAGLLWVGPEPETLAEGMSGGTPLPLSRQEVQCLDGVAVDVRQVRSGLVRSGSVAPAPVPGAPRGLVTVVDGLLVPHLTPEHVVTEEAVGLDLVALQLRTAAGEDVPYELVPQPAAGAVLRGRGRVTGLHWPEGLRVESACRPGRDVPYDGIVAVLAVAAPTAEEALALLRDGLARTRVEGVELSVPDVEEALR